MLIVNMLEAKTSLSELVDAVESGVEREIIIARNGKPAARLVSLNNERPREPRRLGLAAAKYPPFDDEAFQRLDADVAKMFFAEDE